MTLINTKLYAKNRGIVIRGSWRTSRLRKKRIKHLNKIIHDAWVEYGYELLETERGLKWRKR